MVAQRDRRAGGNLITIVIPLEPKPKGRPRFANGHAYTPAETREYEDAVRLIARRVIKAPLRGAISMKVDFYLKAPKRLSEAKFRLLERPVKKPDIDNLGKAILDSLNGGIGYLDDKQVVELRLRKFYGKTPMTVIVLEELDEKNQGNDGNQSQH